MNSQKPNDIHDNILGRKMDLEIRNLYQLHRVIRMTSEGVGESGLMTGPEGSKTPIQRNPGQGRDNTALRNPVPEGTEVGYREPHPVLETRQSFPTISLQNPPGR